MRYWSSPCFASFQIQKHQHNQEKSNIPKKCCINTVHKREGKKANRERGDLANHFLAHDFNLVKAFCELGMFGLGLSIVDLEVLEFVKTLLFLLLFLSLFYAPLSSLLFPFLQLPPLIFYPNHRRRHLGPTSLSPPRYTGFIFGESTLYLHVIWPKHT